MNLTTRLFSRLGLLQAASLLCIPALIFDLVLVFWHQSKSVFLPFIDYVASLQIALPPAVLFALSYMIAFLTGIPLSDAPKHVVAYFRNRILQSEPFMVWGILCTAVLLLGGFWMVQEKAPPAYVHLVEAIMRGEADDFKEARKVASDLKESSPDVGEQVEVVIDVFVERALVNHKAANQSAAKSRLLVATLSSDVGTPWIMRILRKHALAEAYSLLGQAIQTVQVESGSAGGFGILSADKLFAESIHLSQSITNSSDPLVLPIVRASAMNNMGNAYLYSGRFDDALQAYHAANSEGAGFTNSGTWGNIIAALIASGKIDQAVEEGERARAWAESSGKALRETSQFVAILVNTALARIAQGDSTGAVNDMQLADSLQDDANTSLNLALAQLMAGNNSGAVKVLRKVAAPLDRAHGDDPQQMGDNPRCAQLLWFLAEPTAELPDRAARLHAFLGQAFTSAELAGVTDHDISKLRQEAAKWLPNFPGECSSLTLIEPVVRLIAGE